jgi:putative hydrolase of the HAD superfamily
MIKAITFDLWNTIMDYNVDYSDNRVAAILAALKNDGYETDRIKTMDAYESAVNFVHITWKNQQRNVATAELIDLILDRLDATLAGATREKLAHELEHAILTKPPQLLDDTKRLLESLHSKFLLGLICDTGMTPGRILRQILSSYGIMDLFSCHVFSNEVGVTKPHPLIFRTALERLGVTAADAVHIGDLLTTDVMGAKAVGMKAVWLNRQAQQAGKILPKFAPDYEVRSLSEILNILQ